jgi:Cobyric acid synthase
MAKKIMIQGTASGAGKSILTTALCRILTQDGYKVAPFKSQNMTTVCHTLPDGRRMARSQAIAAYACKSEPNPVMNPILLMMGKDGTEVLVSGKSMGIMNLHEYKEYKKQAFNQVLEAYNRLAELNDIIIIEGAGSPVELNLNKDDIVNMGLAKVVNAPVLLVSDIVRGGVFASMYGTMALFTEEEKQLVKGLVINKFKGNTEYFKDGVAILEELCGQPILGVVPYTDIGLEDEDSLTDGEMKTKETIESKLKITDYNDYIQSEFDRIAAHFRANLDMPKINDILI